MGIHNWALFRKTSLRCFFSLKVQSFRKYLLDLSWTICVQKTCLQLAKWRLSLQTYQSSPIQNVNVCGLIDFQVREIQNFSPLTHSSLVQVHIALFNIATMKDNDEEYFNIAAAILIAKIRNMQNSWAFYEKRNKCLNVATIHFSNPLHSCCFLEILS